MRRLICSTLIALLAGIAAPAQASISILATDPAAFIDGSGFQWHGSTPFDNGVGLEGFVEWAVYGPGDFPAAFTGYTPTSGELTYAYQIFVTGTKEVSSLGIAIEAPNPADHIGMFSGGGVSGDAPTSSTFGGLPPDSADWDFLGISTLGSSQGLAFSSPAFPFARYGSVIDGGTFGLVDPLPSPSAEVIPEAGSLAVWLGLGVVGVLYSRRRSSR